jgi:hypothetical protein
MKTGHCWLCHYSNPSETATCFRSGCPMMADLNPQPPPTPNDSRPIWELVIEDMKARDEHGRKEYGTPLQAHNGRDALVDAYQECLDMAVYLKQAIVERDTFNEALTRMMKSGDPGVPRPPAE